MTPLAPYSAAPAKGWQPWGLVTPLLAFLFVVVPFAPVELTLQHLHLLDAGEAPVGMTGFLAFLLLPFGLIGLLVLGWTRFVERRSSATIGLTRIGRAGGFLRGLAVGWAMTAAIVAAIWASGGVQAAGIAPAFGSPTALLDILLLLAGFTVQASVEEITFRGWLF